MNSPVSFINSPCLPLSRNTEGDNHTGRTQNTAQSEKVLVIMILDGEQVLEGVSKTFVRYPGEEHGAWLQRLTHLHCQNQASHTTGAVCAVFSY